MSEKYSSIQEAAARRFKEGAPNLCGLGDRTGGECRNATIALFALAIDHGTRDGILKVALDVLHFLDQDPGYCRDWGHNEAVTRSMACLIDAIDRRDWDRINKAIEALSDSNG